MVVKTSMEYTDSPWIIKESYFNQEWLGKYESIMTLGNGYMGVRTSTEESYLNEIRNTFVAGTFNKFDENEVTELPNVPDFINIEMRINGERLDLSQGTVENYERTLNLKNGELLRSFIWTSNNGDKLEFLFKRLVSKENLHVIAQRVEVTPLSSQVEIEFNSGIDGQVSNSGSQHFSEGAKRLYDNKFLQMVPQTSESKIDFVLHTAHTLSIGDKILDPKSRVEMHRRQIMMKYWQDVSTNETLVLEKISSIHTSRDKFTDKLNLDELKDHGLNQIKEAVEMGYDRLLLDSSAKWNEDVWDIHPIKIESTNVKDQLAINFAKYHLHVMTPAHDNRMNIGAKGLSGEGYKGHTFWDTEIFMLPYFIYTHPEIAKSLLEYRYLGLDGARRKAKDNDYEGAQYPWESAWITDGETTPVWGAADIVTGKSTKIWSGFIEQHITSDVAYGIFQYVQASNDTEFLENKGYEILLDTAKFWNSRLEYNAENDTYHINEVIGPDEYKEHIDDNAFTNYTAKWNIELAIKIYEELKDNDNYKDLIQRLEIERVYPEWLDKVNKIFIPKPNEDLIIPQDSTYLSKEIIDLSKYKADEEVGTLFHDYNLEQVNNMQITKQADVLLLIFLFEYLFDDEVKLANWNYYEPKTMHDSSLSLSTHSALASDLGNIDMAYDFFKQAINIDMGPSMKSSDAGIHAASLGGIWQMIVFGFGGVRALDGLLRIDPHLPREWSSLEFGLSWHGDDLKVEVRDGNLMVQNVTGNKEVSFTCRSKEFTFTDTITIDLEKGERK